VGRTSPACTPARRTSPIYALKGFAYDASGGAIAPMDIFEGHQTGVWLATLPDDGLTGGSFHLGQPLFRCIACGEGEIHNDTRASRCL